MNDMNANTPEPVNPGNSSQQPGLPSQPSQPMSQPAPQRTPFSQPVSGAYSGYQGQDSPTLASGPFAQPPFHPYTAPGMGSGVPGVSGSYPPPAGPGFTPYGQPPIPPTPPRRVALKPWQWALIVVGVLTLCCVCTGIGSAISNAAGGSSSGSSTNQISHHTGPTDTPSATNTPAPTPTATHVPQWTTVQNFSGNGNKQTGTFNAPDDWRLVWTCDPSSDYFGQYNLIVDVDNSDGTPLDIGAINTICQQGNTGDYTEEHSGGQVYLNVTSEAAWTVQVQVLQ